MTTSSTYAFNPVAAEVFSAAFAMSGIKRTEITTQHITDAAYQANMLLVEFSNYNPNQWALETQSIVLTPGNGLYALTNRTIAVAVAYIETTSGTTITGRVLGPISASEYAAIPNKAQQGFPNAYWVNLQATSPTLTLYYVPDSAYTYTLKLQTFRQMQDLSPANGQNIDLPYRFLDAFTTGLAARLSLDYMPDRFDRLNALYKERFQLAAERDQENVNIYIAPGFQGYFR